MKILMSHNMSGVSESEVFELRKEYTQKLIDKFKDVQIIDNYTHHMSPEATAVIADDDTIVYNDYSRIVDQWLLPVNDNNNCYRFLSADFQQYNNINSLKLWHLGRSIQQLGQADAIYFIPGHCDSRGCRVEKVIAKLYNIRVLKLDDDPKDMFIEQDDITEDLTEDEILSRISNSLKYQAEELQLAEYIDNINKSLKNKIVVPEFLKDFSKDNTNKVSR